MDVTECIEKGLLKQIEKNSKKALRSIEMSKLKLMKASKLLDAGFSEDSFANSYTAIFHASRALLFRDGFKERSHYAVYVYLKEKYANKLEPRFLNEFDILRMERHEIQYSLEPKNIKKEESVRVLRVAKDFVNVIEKLVK